MMTSQPPTHPPVAVTVQPVQPPLVAALTGGILTYCGLIIAGVAALMATDHFSDLDTFSKTAAIMAAMAALVAGPLALFSMANSINQARFAETQSVLTNKMDDARLWAMRLGNASLVAILIASISAAFTIYAFSFDSVGSVTNEPGYVVEFQPLASAGQVTQGIVVCYPRPLGAEASMPVQICVIKR